MTNTTLPTLTSAASVADNDLFIIRKVGQTSDQQVYGRSILAYISAKTSGFSVTADQITDATTLGKQIIRAASTAAAQDALGGTAVGKSVFNAATTAAAQDSLGGAAFGKAVFQAATTAAAHDMLEAGAAGLPVYKAATTAAALDTLGFGAYGKGFIAVATTAAAQNYLEAGAAGLQIFKAATTADVLNITGALTSANFSTSAQATAGTSNGTIMTPNGVRNAIEKFAFTSAQFATSAQATAGTSDGTMMSPVNVRNSIEKFAMTSANFSTSAQATAGTSNGTIMSPNAVRNAIEKFALTSAAIATTAQATAGTSDGSLMTPVNVKNSIEKFAFTSASFATTAQAIAGASNGTVMNPVLTMNAMQSATINRLQTIWVPAPSIRPSSTGGCAALALVATSANQPDISTLDFDASTREYAQFIVTFPKGWNASTLTSQFHWSHPSTVTNFGVVWDIQGVSVADNEGIDANYGTAQQIADTGGTTNRLYITGATPAITIGGTPAAGTETVFFRISRVTTDGSDTMAVDARLHGLRLFYTITTLDDT